METEYAVLKYFIRFTLQQLGISLLQFIIYWHVCAFYSFIVTFNDVKRPGDTTEVSNLISQTVWIIFLYRL